MEALRDELAYYEETKPRLLAEYRNQYALIKGRDLIGVYPTREQAYEEGFARYRSESFLVKQVVEAETPQHLPMLYLAAGASRGARL